MTRPSVRRPAVSPVPRESLDRCALRAGLRGDAMLGTAFPAAKVLLVEQPGAWGPNGLADSAFGADTAARLVERAGKAGVRVIGIRRPGRTPAGQARRWALIDSRPGQRRQWWGSYDEPEELLSTAFDRGEPSDDPVYLVCTNGKHDACCALRGRVVAQALAEQAPYRTWECTHLGGDRFAANVLVLPTGVLYGRVLSFAAADLVGATERGEVLGELMRGRIGLAPAAQAALVFAYSDLGTRRLDALQVTAVEAIDRQRTRVRLSVDRSAFGGHTDVDELEVEVRAERVDVPDSLACRGSGPGSFVRYRPSGAQTLRS